MLDAERGVGGVVEGNQSIYFFGGCCAGVPPGVEEGWRGMDDAETAVVEAVMLTRWSLVWVAAGYSVCCRVPREYHVVCITQGTEGWSDGLFGLEEEEEKAALIWEQRLVGSRAALHIGKGLFLLLFALQLQHWLKLICCAHGVNV